jgi:hypothetical protein
VLTNFILILNTATKPPSLWLDSWGIRPPISDQARTIAKKEFMNAPILIPIEHNAYIPSEPTKGGNPVISYLAIEMCYSAPNLVDYFQLRLKHPWLGRTKEVVQPIRFWDDLIRHDDYPLL